MRTGAAQFFQLVQTSLDNMCMGGIYDHVGGGFARYATDERWLVPHFEKMLYDNAQLVDVLTLVWQQNRNPLYRDRIEETIGWVLRDMKVGDALRLQLRCRFRRRGRQILSSGPKPEIDAALAGTFSQRFKQVYNVRREGNWEGKNILHRIGGSVYPLPDADEALFKKQRELLLRRPRQARARHCATTRCWPIGTA